MFAHKTTVANNVGILRNRIKLFGSSGRLVEHLFLVKLPRPNYVLAVRIFPAVAVAIALLFMLSFSAVAHDDAVTFTRDIAPIIFDHCASCHHTGQAAPFSLLTYSD